MEPVAALGLAGVLVVVGLVIVVAGRWGYDRLSAPGGSSLERHRQRTPEEIDAEREDRAAARALQRHQTEIAFRRYTETAVAMVPMVESPRRLSESLESWFDILAASLAAALAKSGGDHYRVAVWMDVGEPDTLRLVGSANHRKNDPGMRSLPRRGTTGGDALRSRTGEAVCPDRRKDRRFRRRPKPYLSIFAIRTGSADKPGAVITIDAPAVATEAFRESDIVIIRRFAQLLAAGATIAAASATRSTRTTDLSAEASPPRMIAATATANDEPEEAA